MIDYEFFNNLKPFETVDDIPDIPIIKDKNLYEKVIVENFIRCGAIPKDKLIVGKTYLGNCRNTDKATWNGKCFVYNRYKNWSYYEDEINHFQDDDGHDLFVPIKQLTMNKNYYVITGEQNWADEFDVFFFEILDEDYYQKYKAAQEILGTLCREYGFGTNEDWDDFDYLDFVPKKITEEQRDFLKELDIRGRGIIDSFFYCLTDLFNDAEIEIDVYEAPLDEFKEALIKLKSETNDDTTDDE